MWKTRIVNTVYEIDEGSWDRVAGGQPQLSHAWQRVLEASARSYTPHYVLLYNDAELIAFAICAPAQSWQLVNPWARRLLNQSTLLSTLPSSTLHAGLAVRSGDRDAAALDALLDALLSASRHHRRVFQALTNVNSLLPPSLDQLARHGFQALALMEGHYLPNRWGCFEDYCKSLGKKHNQEVHTYQRKARELDVTITRSRQFAAHADVLYNLLLNVQRKHYPPGVSHYMKPDVFKVLEHERPAGTELMLVSADDQIVAFSLCQSGDGLMFMGPLLGLDYQRSQKTYAYFLLYYEVIQAAIDYGCRGIYAGLGIHDIKGRLGFEPVPRHLCLRGTSHWLNQPLSWIFKLLSRHRAYPANSES
jgi:predicted N-acyltransferase